VDVFEGDDVYEIVVEGQRQEPELTEHIVSSEVARTLPGTGGDIVRVVQNLPGVARSPLGIGQLLIRGTAPEDSRTYLDGAEIPLVFHFAGLSTVINGDAIEEVAFLPGNYGVRYGRSLGGVVDLRLSRKLPERSAGYASVDLFQATGFVQARLGEKAALTVSGRRSYIDAVLTPVLSGLGSASVQAPRYYDVQTRLLAETGDSGTLDALLLWSDDRFAVVGSDADGAERTEIGLGTRFAKLRLLHAQELGDGWRNEASVLLGPAQQTFDLAPRGTAREDAVTAAFREELYRGPGDRGVGLRAGVDIQAGSAGYDFDVPGFGAREAASVARVAPGAYVEPTVRIGALDVVPGLRVDGLILDDRYAAWTWDPRVAARLGRGATTVKASSGLYSQWPTLRQAVQRPNLRAARAWQTAVGLDQRLTADVSLQLNAYTNQLSGLVSGREDAFRFFTGPPPVGPVDTGDYANDGTGAVWGSEALVRLQTERTTAWLSATVSRSTRVDRPGDTPGLFTYDQPVAITALGSHTMGRGWRLGARGRFGSGNPYTPVVNRFQTFDQRGFAPVYGALDSARIPPFWQLDVRVDKTWALRGWELTAYLDLQNATNAQNVEVMAWTYDYAAQDPITQIPIVPAFGVRGDF